MEDRPPNRIASEIYFQSVLEQIIGNIKSRSERKLSLPETCNCVSLEALPKLFTASHVIKTPESLFARLSVDKTWPKYIWYHCPRLKTCVISKCRVWHFLPTRIGSGVLIGLSNLGKPSNFRAHDPNVIFHSGKRKKLQALQASGLWKLIVE